MKWAKLSKKRSATSWHNVKRRYRRRACTQWWKARKVRLESNVDEDLVDHCRSYEKRAFHLVGKAVKEEKHNFPGRSKVESWSSRSTCTQWLKAGREQLDPRDGATVHWSLEELRERAKRPTNNEAELQMKAALRNSSTLDDKIPLLVTLTKSPQYTNNAISTALEEINRSNGKDHSRRREYIIVIFKRIFYL